MGFFEFATWDDGSYVRIIFNDTNRRATAVEARCNGGIPTTVPGFVGWLVLPNGTKVEKLFQPLTPRAAETVQLPANNGLTVETVQNEPGDPPGTHLVLTGKQDYGITSLA